MFGRGALVIFLTMAMLGADGVILTAVGRCDAAGEKSNKTCGCKPEKCPANQGVGIVGTCCDVSAPASPTSIPLARVKSSAAPISAPAIDRTDSPLPTLDTAFRLLDAVPQQNTHSPPRYHLHCSYLI